MTADNRARQRGRDRPRLIGKAAESRATATLEDDDAWRRRAGRRRASTAGLEQGDGLSRATCLSRAGRRAGRRRASTAGLEQGDCLSRATGLSRAGRRAGRCKASTAGLEQGDDGWAG